jgi:hypothetical protein
VLKAFITPPLGFTDIANRSLAHGIRNDEFLPNNSLSGQGIAESTLILLQKILYLFSGAGLGIES